MFKPTSDRGVRPGWRGAALALAVYTGVTVLYFVGALPWMAEGFPGGAVAAIDGWQQVWHLWWIQQALSQGHSPFQTTLIYYPGGVNLAVHPLTLATGLGVAPVTALAGPIVAYNVALLMGFMLTGLGGYLLALRAGARFGAALGAGLLLTFAPFHAAKAYDGQMEFVSLQWVALYAWALLATVETRNWRWPALAGLLLSVVGYTSLYYLVYSALFSVLVATLWLPWERRRTGPYLARLALIPAVAGVVLLPLLLNLRQSLAEITGGVAPGAPAMNDLISRSADLVDFWLPSNLHPLWGPAVSALGPVLHPGIAAWNHALGYSALGLAIVGCATAWPRAWRWLAIVVTALVFALGPNLLIAARDTGIPLPYRLLILVPGMSVARRPAHLIVIAVLALTPLVGLGLSWLQRRLGRRAVAAALVLAAIELAPPPWPIQVAATHPAYAGLRARPGAVMVLPVEIDSSDTLRDQITHGRPLVGGFMARTPPYPFAELTPGVRQLWRLEPDPAALADPVGGPPAQVLAAYGITDVVVRWDRLTPARRADAEAALAQALPNVVPAYADTGLSIYQVPPSNGMPLTFFGAGWYAEERDGPRRWRWMSSAAELTLLNPGSAPRPVQLLLRAESYGRSRSVNLSLNGVPAAVWMVSAQPMVSVRSLRLLLPPGENRLALTAPAEPDPSGRGPISISVSAVVLEPGQNRLRSEP